MIEINHITKKFEGFCAVDDVTLKIEEKNVFGLIGTNGAGKSTVLRMLAGVLKPDEGEIMVENEMVYDHIQGKRHIFFISDEPYFFANSNAEEMVSYYESIYEGYQRERFFEYLEKFGLERRRKIRTFSKGMKKQLAILLGICANTKYLLCDETFDGLDPVMRQGVKSIFAKEIEERGLTPIIASHNLRELEDICDHIGLLHKGGVLLDKDLMDAKCSVCKVQCVFKDDEQAETALRELDIRKEEKRGRLYTLVIEGERDHVEAYFKKISPVFFEVLSLSLEEIFISETEVAGYDIKKIILG